LSISTCMPDWACVTSGQMNAMQHAIQDIGIPLVGKRLFIAALDMDTKGELFPFVILSNSSNLPWNSSWRPYAED
jgi:hypothetical protein